MMLRTKYWTEMSWAEFRDTDMSRVIAVLPVAAVEQHGPHLPVGVDSFIMEGYLRRVVERVPSELPMLLLPLQMVGKSNEHQRFPGTLTLTAETAMRSWTEIAESVARTGCRKIILLNSHGGNVPALEIAAREIRVRLGMLAVVASWSRFGQPDGLYSASERTHGIHAGDIETSLMMVFRPELVRTDLAENAVPASVAIEREFTWLRVTQPIGFGWAAQDVSPTGAMGDASIASPLKGEASADYGATAFIELLHDVDEFDLARLKAGPLKRS